MTRVVLIDDHGLFRARVRTELGEQVEVVGDAGTVEEAVELIVREAPDVVLLDVHMPGGGGVEVIRRVAGAHAPGVRFLALSVSDAPDDVISVIRAGARGYVTKTISGPELIDAVRRVAEGDAVFSPRLAGFVLDAFAGAPAGVVDADPELDQLTDREGEVLRLIARGYRSGLRLRAWPRAPALSAPVRVLDEERGVSSERTTPRGGRGAALRRRARPRASCRVGQTELALALGQRLADATAAARR